MKRFINLLPLVDPAGYGASGELDRLYENNHDDDGERHQACFKTLVTVADGKIAYPAAAHNAHHRGVGDEANGGRGQTQYKPGTSFHVQKFKNKLEGGCPHRSSGFNYTLGHLKQ